MNQKIAQHSPRETIVEKPGAVWRRRGDDPLERDLFHLSQGAAAYPLPCSPISREEPYHHSDEDAYLRFITIAKNSFSLLVVKRQRFLANDLASCLRGLPNRARVEQGGQANVRNLHLAQQRVHRIVDRAAVGLSGGAAAVHNTRIQTPDRHAEFVPRLKVLHTHCAGAQDADPQSL